VAEGLYCTTCGAEVTHGDRFCGMCGNTLKPEQAKRRRVAALAAIVFVAGIAALVGWRLLTAVDGVPDASGPVIVDPQDVDLPALSGDGDQAREFLVTGDGRLLVEFHAVTASLQDLDLRSDDAAEACRIFVGRHLVGIAPEPADLIAISAGVPDEHTGHMFVNDVAAKRDLLSSCAAADIDSAVNYQQEARFTHVLVTRRLAELGIASEEGS